MRVKPISVRRVVAPRPGCGNGMSQGHISIGHKTLPQLITSGRTVVNGQVGRQPGEGIMACLPPYVSTANEVQNLPNLGIWVHWNGLLHQPDDTTHSIWQSTLVK